MLYVYAITDSPELPQVGGLHGAPLRSVSAEGLHAVVTEHDRRPESDEEALWGHEAVVEALMDLGDLLPMRFGNVVSDESELQKVLSARLPGLEAALARVHGAVELSVRAQIDAGAAQVEETAPIGEGAERPGTAYMRSRLEQSRLAEQTVARIHEPLAAVSRSATRGASAPAGTLKAAYLVDRERVDSFGKLVDELSGQVAGATIACTGPWPQYSFVGAEER
jgi:hypothetical protein